MPLIKLSQQEYADDARKLGDKLKCHPKGGEGDNYFAMSDLGRLDLYTEPGLMRQIDSLKGRGSQQFDLDPQSCEISEGLNNGVAIQGDVRRILSGNFIDSVNHYYQRRVVVKASETDGSIESASPALSSNFLRVLLRDAADLPELGNIRIATSRNVLDCIENRKKVVVLNYESIKNSLGYPFTQEEITQALQHFGYTINGEIPGGLRVEIPFHRVDIVSESDVIEDVMLYYLGLFKGDFPFQVRNSDGFDYALRREQAISSKLVNGLVSFGFKEVKTPVLGKTPNSRNYKLRDDLLVTFLAYEQKHQHILMPHHVFELGQVRDDDKLSNHLGLGVVGNNVDFNHLFSIIHSLMVDTFGMYITLKPSSSSKYETGKAFGIVCGNKLIGEIGIVAASKIPGGKLRHQCMYAELYLHLLNE